MDIIGAVLLFIVLMVSVWFFYYVMYEHELNRIMAKHIRYFKTKTIGNFIFVHKRVDSYDHILIYINTMKRNNLIYKSMFLGNQMSCDPRDNLHVDGPWEKDFKKARKELRRLYNNDLNKDKILEKERIETLKSQYKTIKGE